MSPHTDEMMEKMAKAHNMTVEELNAHIKEHETMEYAETHAILMTKEFTDEELTVMAKEHGMSLEQMKEHIALARQHHPS